MNRSEATHKTFLDLAQVAPETSNRRRILLSDHKRAIFEMARMLGEKAEYADEFLASNRRHTLLCLYPF